ncbi:MAG: hypothetical protein LQ352_008327 [Teloschistes flavicans]|nr:MAG: hypothetical protein LQ352_008327 [Teloschistes flavicans]
MGRSVARLLAEKGANVVIVARNLQRLEEALEHATISHPPPKPDAWSQKPPPGIITPHPTSFGAAPAPPTLPSSSMPPSPNSKTKSPPITSRPPTSLTPP